MSCPRCNSGLKRQEEQGVVFDGCLMCGHRRYLKRIDILKELAEKDPLHTFIAAIGSVRFRELQEVLGGKVLYIPKRPVSRKPPKRKDGMKRGPLEKNRERDLAIAAAHKKGVKVRVLAKRFGLSRNSILYIVRREENLAG